VRERQHLVRQHVRSLAAPVMNTTRRRCRLSAALIPSLLTSSLKLTSLYSNFFSSLVYAPLRTVKNRWPQKTGSAATGNVMREK